ncbi:MAG: DNA repair protein RadC [Alcaligenaceae bacterium]|nr:DNA repair protein RadC [Alcaligenaceae bacterium]
MSTYRFISSQERPRERLINHGPQVLTTPELLAIILRTGVNGCDAVNFGARLLNEFGGLRSLLAADIALLQKVKGLGNAKICQLLAIHELAQRSLEEELQSRSALDHPQKVKAYCSSKLAHLTVEHCMAIYLDTRYRLICSEEISQGTLSQASVYPRELIKSALKHHAAAVILSHNHPSGIPEPSMADITLTQHIRKALQLVDIKLLDHLIVAAGQTVSLAEKGDI